MTCAGNYVNCMSRRAGDAAKVSPMFRNNAACHVRPYKYKWISVMRATRACARVRCSRSD